MCSKGMRPVADMGVQKEMCAIGRTAKDIEAAGGDGKRGKLAEIGETCEKATDAQGRVGVKGVMEVVGCESKGCS